jgi:hypothetical protein
MSRVWRWRARGALVRRAARAGADLARRRVGWNGREAARTTATRSAAEPRSYNSPLGLGREGRHSAKRAKATATGAACGREERSLGRTAEADAEFAVGEWAGAGERPCARRRRGRRRGRDSSTRSWARDAEGAAVRECEDSRHGGGWRVRGARAQAYGEEPTQGSQMPSGRRGREAARPTAKCRRRSRDFVDSHLRLGDEEGQGAQGRGQRPQRRRSGARSDRPGVRR